MTPPCPIDAAGFCALHGRPHTGKRLKYYATSMDEKAQRMRALWNGEPAAEISGMCIHLGEPTGELQPCPPPSLCRAKVFACAHAEHGPTTTIRKCSGCPGYEAKVG